ALALLTAVDTDGAGMISAAEAYAAWVRVGRMSAGLEPPDLVYDFNGDGVITLTDWVAMGRVGALELGHSPPAGASLEAVSARGLGPDAVAVSEPVAEAPSVWTLELSLPQRLVVSPPVDPVLPPALVAAVELGRAGPATVTFSTGTSAALMTDTAKSSIDPQPSLDQPKAIAEARVTETGPQIKETPVEDPAPVALPMSEPVAVDPPTSLAPRADTSHLESPAPVEMAPPAIMPSAPWAVPTAYLWDGVHWGYWRGAQWVYWDDSTGTWVSPAQKYSD
ncbi:MAG: hypothetical protein HY600_01650, partial [Candidatus Omnitrophica bacterium]|nr:hypothetical protein [Candidatus Omnitrophota bacterium]